MTDFIELELHIEKTSPDTISAKELLDIARTWVAVMGEEYHIHLKEVRNGCACVVTKVRSHAIKKVSENINKPESKARLNKKMANYNRYGFIKPANDNVKDFLQIDLQGIKLYKNDENTVIHDETQIKGKIISISGKDKTVNIRLLGTSGEVYRCVIEDTEAKNMSWGDYIQADVVGDWILLENGKWDMPLRKKLTIKKYKKIHMEQDPKIILDKMANIISEDTFQKIQNEIKLDRKTE